LGRSPPLFRICCGIIFCATPFRDVSLVDLWDLLLHFKHLDLRFYQVLSVTPGPSSPRVVINGVGLDWCSNSGWNSGFPRNGFPAPRRNPGSVSPLLDSVSVIQLPLSSFSCLVFVIQIPLFNLRYLVLAIQICYLVFGFGIVIRFSFRHSVSGIRVSFVRSSPANQLLPTLVLVLLGSLLAIVRVCHGKMFRFCFSGMWFLQFP